MGWLALAGVPAVAATVERPLILTLAAPGATAEQVTQRLRATARVPVRAVRLLGPQQAAAVLRCRSVPQCDAAQARLAAATSWVQAVDLDGVRTRPTPAAASAAR